MCPIPASGFSLQTVLDEYGTNSEPATHGLSQFHLDILGTNNAGDDLDNFANYGKPTLSGVGVNTKDEDSFTIGFTIDINLVTSFVKLQWHVDDANPPFSGQTISETAFTQFNSNTTSSLSTPNTLSSTTTYQYRLVYYNKFNDNSADYSTTTPASLTTDAPPALTTPVISGATAQYNGVDGYISFTYSDDEDGFDVEVRIDGSTTNTATQDCNANVGTSSNPVEIRFGWSTFPNSSIEFRVRATSNTITDSGWSGWKTATSVPLFQLPSCPL